MKHFQINFFSNFIRKLYFLIKYKNTKKCIYLSALGLSCGTLNFPSSQHERPLVAACKLLVVACEIQLPDQGLNLGPLP